MKVLLILAFLISIPASAAKMVPFSYDNELCACSGMVDSSSAEKMEGAFKISSINRYSNDEEVKKLVGKPIPEIKKVIETQTKKYQDIQKSFISLKLPDGKTWDDIRKFYLRNASLSHFLEMGTLNYLAKDPQFLLKDFEGQKISSECVDYALTLQKDKDIDKMLKIVSEKACVKNQNPPQCMKDIQSRNPRIEILVNGWENCVNNQFRAKYSDPKELEGALKELEKNIKGLKCECDEP
jgi:hypothetical protein